MRRHEYESRYNPAVTELSRALINDGGIHPDTLDKITRVLDGVEVTDNLLVQKDNVINQKTTELQSKNNLLVQKEQLLGQKDNQLNQFQQIITTKTVELQSKENLLAQKEQLLVQKDSVINQKTVEIQSKEQKLGKFIKTEFADSLHKLYPDSYSTDPNKWFYKDGKPLPMKVHYDTNNIQVMEKNINFYKERLTEKEQEDIKREFIASLHERYPDTYSTDPSQWFFKTGEKAGEEYPMKTHYDNNNFYVMVKNTKTYQKEIEEINTKKLEDAKRLKEEEEARKEQLLNDQAQEIARVKEQLKLKEFQSQNKDQLILAKELDNQELARQKEIEKQEILTQKESELVNKSLIKNQVIDLKEKDVLNLKIESLMKQLEFKDRALEDAHEIAKQNKIINELQGKLLAFKDLSKHDETLQLELSVIHFKVEESILGGNVEEMKELSKYLSQLMKEPIEKEESLDISELLNNLSPVHVQENLVQNTVAVINNGNFDIDNQHITHSVLLSGGESFSIIQEESFN
jgi:hypothetical protein